MYTINGQDKNIHIICLDELNKDKESKLWR